MRRGGWIFKINYILTILLNCSEYVRCLGRFQYLVLAMVHAKRSGAISFDGYIHIIQYINSTKELLKNSNSGVGTVRHLNASDIHIGWGFKVAGLELR
jgi:hypothetical protein